MAHTDSHGTQSATVTTEHTLYDSSAAGTFQLYVDTVNMVAGDVLELRCYVMVLTSGTRRGYLLARYADAQPTDDLIKSSIPVSTALTDSGAVRFTLKQTAGTSRNFPWNVNNWT